MNEAMKENGRYYSVLPTFVLV